MARAPYAREGFGTGLEEFAYLPKTTLGHLEHELPEGAGTRETLCRSWQAAQASGLVVDKGERVFFPIEDGVRRGDGFRLVATLSPNIHPGTQPWALSYAGPDRYHVLDALADDPETPRRLESFAYVPWNQALDDVATAALSEPWGFEDDPTAILSSYLKYTYQRAALQGKVLYSKADGLAAFNTGLVDRGYDDLFLCFTPNPRQGLQYWIYAGVCTAGRRGLGKQLVETFHQLPQHVTYFDDVSDLIFDSSQELYVDTRHILVDNVDRLPLAFLREELRDRPDLLTTLDEAEKATPDNKAPYQPIRDALESDDFLFRRLRNRLDDAIDLARRRARWNYRTAIPSYYPTTNEMSLLLPLYLTSASRSDNALVVHLSESGSYIGETILTMRQAYLDARLVCRPEHDWLLPG